MKSGYSVKCFKHSSPILKTSNWIDEAIKRVKSVMDCSLIIKLDKDLEMTLNFSFYWDF